MVTRLQRAVARVTGVASNKCEKDCQTTGFDLLRCGSDVENRTVPGLRSALVLKPSAH